MRHAAENFCRLESADTAVGIPELLGRHQPRPRQLSRSGCAPGCPSFPRDRNRGSRQLVLLVGWPKIENIQQGGQVRKS